MTGIQRLRSFLGSPHHAWLGLLTLGVGAATVSVPGAIAGAAAYALGWVFLPDSKWFRKWVDKREKTRKADVIEESSEQFQERREELYRQLSKSNRQAYDELAEAAEDIRESFEKERDDHHSGRLGQLVWTYLRLLLTRQSLERFLRTESSREIKGQLADVEEEVGELEDRSRKLEEAGNPSEMESVRRLLQSKESRVESLQQRLEHVSKAENDLALTGAEIDRILDAVRLIKADFMARRDLGQLGNEIDRTTSNFNRTHDWLRGLEFDSSPSDITDEVTARAPLRVGDDD